MQSNHPGLIDFVQVKAIAHRPGQTSQSLHERVGGCFSIKRERRLERGSIACLQAEAPKAAGTRLLDYPFQHGPPDTLAEMIRMRTHRLHLAGRIRPLLERADARDGIAIPGGPDRHVG